MDVPLRAVKRIEVLARLRLGEAFAVQTRLHFLARRADETAKGLVNFLDTRMEISSFEAVPPDQIGALSFRFLN